MRTLYHIIARFYEARSTRALAKHIALRRLAEKFFRRRDAA